MSDSKSGKLSNWKYGNSSKRQRTSQLSPGMKGFLCTCNSHLRERDCIRDSYNLLNLYADKLVAVTQEASVEVKSEDNLDAALTEELAELKKASSKTGFRFQALETGAKGVVFIKTTVPEPEKIVQAIVSDINKYRVQQSKNLLRLLPVEMTCKAYLEDITRATEAIFPKYFSAGEKTFSILYTHRNNNTLVKGDVIDALAGQISALNETNKVNLTSPDLVVLVEVIKGICCLAVVPNYYEFKKYNLLELCIPADVVISPETLEGM